MANADLPGILRRHLLLLAGLWALSIGSALLVVLHGNDGFHWLFFPSPMFDYYDYIWRMKFLHRPEFFTRTGYRWYYPPAAVFLLQAFYRIGDLAHSWVAGYLAYLAVAVGGALTAAFALARGLARRGVSLAHARAFALLCCLLSWPLYFALQRGNIEAVTFLLLLAAAAAYARGRWLVTAVLVGFAGCFKLYPLLCLALFLRPRRWRELAVGSALAVLMTALGLRYLEPNLTIAAHGVFSGIEQWTVDYAVFYGRLSAPYDHSLYELSKLSTLALHPNYPKLLNTYLFSAAALALGLFFLRVIRLPRTNQLLYLLVAATLLPPASFDYTLLNLYAAFGWLVLVAAQLQQDGQRSRPTDAALLLLGLLLGPETFLLWNGIVWAGIVKGVVLLCLAALAVTCPLPDLQPQRGRASMS